MVLATAAVAAVLCFSPAALLAQGPVYYGGSWHQLSSLTCSKASLAGAGTDVCTVALNSAASSAGLWVSLRSSNGAVTMPSSVTVAPGGTSVAFTATVAAVKTAQTVTLTAADWNTSITSVLELNAGTTAGTAGLTLGSTSVAFGNVALNTPSTQTVTLTASGSGAVTISSVAIAGAGFSMSGLTTPLTLNSGQSAALNVAFDPAAAGAATGTVTISSNATNGATATIALTGTGSSSTGYQVELSWDAPSSSPASVSGYHVYRAPSGSTSFQLLTSSAQAATSYTDTTVASGSTYDYEVTSVDGSGVESTPSAIYTAKIP